MEAKISTGAAAFMPPHPHSRISTSLTDVTCTGSIPRTAEDWEGRVYTRLSVLPEGAEPAQRAQLVAALSVGTEIIRLRRIADRFNRGVDLDAALEPLKQGSTAVATKRLAQVDHILAALPDSMPGRSVRLRARGSILAIVQALTQYPAFFNARTSR
jgi:hypothetical protein